MASLSIYLKFDGNCEEAFKLYESVFNSEITFISRYSDVPRIEEEGMPTIPEDQLERIENICLPIKDGTVLMGSDGMEVYGTTPVMGTNFTIYVQAESREEAFQIFDGLSDGGKVQMPISRAHWGDYFGSCTDKFGISWFVNFSPKPE